jgi:hypothetical protein
MDDSCEGMHGEMCPEEDHRARLEDRDEGTQDPGTTLSRRLGSSHFLAILPFNDRLQRDVYAPMCRIERRNVRMLREKIGGDALRAIGHFEEAGAAGREGTGETQGGGYSKRTSR